MILEDVPVRIHCRKVGDRGFMVRYHCPISGSFRSISLRKTGIFSTRESALTWAQDNVRSFINQKAKCIPSGKWRLNMPILKRFNEYAVWRNSEFPRSARHELSVLRNYVFPYFVSVQNLNDPNRWGEFGYEFSEWLQNGAKTMDDTPIAKATAQRAISTANQFLKWMRKRKYIAYSSYRAIEMINPRKIYKRSYLDLVSDEVFEQVHALLKTRSQLYADMWYVQRKMGYRVSELMGLAFHWLSDSCPIFIAEEFEAKGFIVFGSVYLQSQIAKEHVARDYSGSVPRAPLKGRASIGVEYSRTIPVVDEKLWSILVRNYEVQLELWNKLEYGEEKENYLLFDEANATVYRGLIAEAFASLGLESTGTHILRHTLSTEWTNLKISERVSELVLGHKAASHERYVHIVGLVNFERLKAAPMPILRKNV